MAPGPSNSCPDLVVVLGMHRTGTSTVTRSLRALGVHLGENFLPPVAGDNDKGYFEDVEVNRLNIEILEKLGYSWDDVATIPQERFKWDVLRPLRQRALELLQSRVNVRPYGMKDPRLCRTLPFWSDVIEALRLVPAYVISARHPNDVYESLKKRGPVQPVSVHYLWLQHLVPALVSTADSRRVVVSYDNMVTEPMRELERLARALGLTFDPSSHAVKEFITEFLDPSLRHHTAHGPEAPAGARFSLEAVSAYRALLTLASDEPGAESPQAIRALDACRVKLEEISPTLECISILERQLKDANAGLAATSSALETSKAELAEVHKTLAERNGDVATLKMEHMSLCEELARERAVATHAADEVRRLEAQHATESADFVRLSAEFSGLSARLRADQASLSEELARERAVSADAAEQIRRLEAQRAMESAELVRLNAELAGLGGRVAMRLNRISERVVPRSARQVVRNLGRSQPLSKSVARVLKERALDAIQDARLRFRPGPLNSDRDPNSSTRTEPTVTSPDMRRRSGEEVSSDHPNFGAWIRSHEPSQQQIAEQKMVSAGWKYRPLISFIVPVYRVSRGVLNETISSIEAQTYDNWQACLAWADPDDHDGWSWINNRVSSDRRFTVLRLKENGGISRNSNAALALAEGEFIALLDHDDTVAPWALFEVVKLLQESPQADFFYSDKDSISADGRTRLNALFKPGWSPEMLHSVNYLTHLNVIRTKLVRDVGGWDPETDGAQDWDIFLRVTEQTKNVVHIQSVLYHWRILPTSTATGIQAKPYAAAGQLRAQQKCFDRLGLPASVLPSEHGLFHVTWPRKPESSHLLVCQTGSPLQLVLTLEALKSTEQGSIRNIFVFHKLERPTSLEAYSEVWGARLILKSCNEAGWRTALLSAAEWVQEGTLVLVDGRVVALSNDFVAELSGWVENHPAIAWASGVATSRNGAVYEAGRVVAQDFQSAPLFNGSSLYSFGWFGGPLWYRNAAAVSPYAVAVRARDVMPRHELLCRASSDILGFAEFCAGLSADGRRGLVNPFAEVVFDGPPETAWPDDGVMYRSDRYFNSAFNQVSPLRLRT